MMTDTPHLPPRPEPRRGLADTAAAWLAWFGVSRLILAAVSVTVVALGVLWLVRAPAAPTEASLPFAATGGSQGGVASTLPPPTTAPATTSTVAPPTRVVVHVAGEVARPGVYELWADARVNSAVEAAGGPLPGADLDGLNLAASIADGQRIYVPAAGEVDPASVPSGPNPATEVGEADGDGAVGPIDLNTATAGQLETLPGIGPATATAIIGDRDRHGPFAAVGDLERVPGIGPAKLAAIADLVTV